MRRTRQEALETRERILDAAEQVFERHGVMRATLADIADRAGVTRGAIYGHFKNKIDVFDAMVDRVQLPMEMLVDESIDPEQAEPLDRLRDALVMVLRSVATNPHTQRVFNILFTKCEYTPHLESLHDRALAAAQVSRARLARSIRNAIDKRQAPADLDPARAAAMLHATMTGVLRDWLLDRSAFSLPGDARAIVDATLGMLLHGALRRTVAARQPPSRNRGTTGRRRAAGVGSRG